MLTYTALPAAQHAVISLRSKLCPARRYQAHSFVHPHHDVPAPDSRQDSEQAGVRSQVDVRAVSLRPRPSSGGNLKAAACEWTLLEHFTETRAGTITAVPLGADNVGRRMLLAMGWRAGTGLGPRCERGWNRRARRGAWQPRDPAPAPRPWLLRRGETEAREDK